VVVDVFVLVFADVVEEVFGVYCWLSDNELLFISDLFFCLLLTMRLILDTEGALSWVHILSLINFHVSPRQTYLDYVIYNW
jgi:hypothetical protein